MRTFIIGLFIVTFLAGAAAKMMNDSSNTTSWLGHILNVIGLKKNDQEQKDKINTIVKDFGNQKERFDEYIQDRERYLKDSQEQVGSLSQIVQDMSDRNSNVDVLRLKDLIHRFKDQNTIMIERGRQLEDFHQKQMQINQKIAQDYEKSSFMSATNRREFLQNIKDNLRQQQSLMDQQMQDNRLLKDKIQQVQENIKQVQHVKALKENTELVEKLQMISDKNQTALEKVSQQQEKLKVINEKNLASIDSIKERIDRLKQIKFNSIDDVHFHIQDQTQAINSRIQDQLEKARERRDNLR